MDVKKKPKHKIDIEIIGFVICILTIFILWGLEYINRTTLESKILDCLLITCAWTVSIFGSKFIMYLKTKLK